VAQDSATDSRAETAAERLKAIRARVAELYRRIKTERDPKSVAELRAEVGKLTELLSELARAGAEVVEAGCRCIQIENLGAWFPHLSGERNFAWVREVIEETLAAAKAFSTSTSRIALFMSWRVLCSFSGSSSGRSSRMLRKHSSRICWVHRARNSPVVPRRMSRSRRGAGYSTHAS